MLNKCFFRTTLLYITSFIKSSSTQQWCYPSQRRSIVIWLLFTSYWPISWPKIHFVKIFLKCIVIMLQDQMIEYSIYHIIYIQYKGLFIIFSYGLHTTLPISHQWDLPLNICIHSRSYLSKSITLRGSSFLVRSHISVGIGINGHSIMYGEKVKKSYLHYQIIVNLFSGCLVPKDQAAPSKMCPILVLEQLHTVNLSEVLEDILPAVDHQQQHYINVKISKCWDKNTYTLIVQSKTFTVKLSNVFYVITMMLSM